MRNTFSIEHEHYLKKIKKRAVLIQISRFALLAILLAVWEILADTEIVNPFITSSPSRIIKTIVSLTAEGTLFFHAGITLAETVVGFIISTVLGTIFALILWWNDFFRKLLEPYIVVINALPKIALGPLIIIWFGTGQKAIIFMTVLVCIIIASMNMLKGFTSTDENKILLLKSMGATKLQILLKLVIPSALTDFISMLKINVGMAWIGSIMGEYIVSKAGLGYLIVYGGQVFKLDLVMSAVALLCIMAAGMYALVALFEKKIIKNTGN